TPGATIAITDAFGYAAAESDLAQYRTKYNLPPCTVASGCLKIVDQTGGSNLPGPPPANNDWTVETALDLDMASAACPNCKLLLVQATDDMGDGLNIAQKTAAMLGATVVSDSWGDTTAGASAMMQEKFFDVSPYKTGIFIAAGDNGYDNYTLGAGKTGPDYPSTSEFVIAVGGTNLKKSSTSARGWTETAWSSGGSSCSDALPTPSWQMGFDTGCKFRAACDVAAVGDPATGVAVFNANSSSSPFNVGGTSASSPFVAGVFALYGHGEVKGDFVYGNKSAWNDVVSGTNGTCGTISCQAGVGWDGPTGWGTPSGKALAMIPPGDGNPPPDMAAPPDLATPPDLAEGGGGSGGGGSGGSGGGTGTGGNGNGGGGGGGTGGHPGGCSLAGSASSGGLWLALVGFAALLARWRRLRP
ncbi:MAG TPA: S53 family peptidase, partial [Polyangia bacterium]